MTAPLLPSAFAGGRGRPVQPLELIRLDDAGMLPVGQHAARLLLELEGELLGDTVAIAADPPAAGNRAVLDLHRDAVERRASLLVRAAQLSQEAVDDAHVQGAEDDRLAAAHGGGVEMPHGQDVNHRPLSLPCSRSRIARRMRLAPSLIGSGVSGAWATVSGCDRPQGVTTLDVTADHVKLYKRGLLEAGMASATVARRLSVLRGAYEQLAAKGLVSWEIAQDIAAVKAPCVQKNATPSLTQRQAVALLEAIPTDTLQGMRDLALMSVFFLTGCRVSAVTGACVGHLETDGVEHYLNVTEKRNKKRRKILLDAARPLLAYVAQAGIKDDREGPLFRPMLPNGSGFERRHLDRKTPWRMVKKYCEAAGIDPSRLGSRGIGIHSLRKTAINDAIRNGASMHEVREFAGHADIRTTELYFIRKEEDAEVAARRIQIRLTGSRGQ